MPLPAHDEGICYMERLCQPHFSDSWAEDTNKVFLQSIFGSFTTRTVTLDCLRSFWLLTYMQFGEAREVSMLRYSIASEHVVTSLHLAFKSIGNIKTCVPRPQLPLPYKCFVGPDLLQRALVLSITYIPARTSSHVLVLRWHYNGASTKQILEGTLAVLATRI